MCMAVGNVSLELWLLFTSSLGWTGRSPWPKTPPARTWARFATTSFTFMLLWVPDPVCHTTKGNWSSSFPARISSHAATIKSFLPASKTPSSALVRAAARFKWAKARTTSMGIDPTGPILKLLRERSVWAPQYLSAGT